MSERKSDQQGRAKRGGKRAPRAPRPEEIETGLEFLNDYFAGLRAKVRVEVQKHSAGEDSSEIIFNLTGEIKPLKQNPQQLAALTRLTSMAMSAGSRDFLRCVIDLDGQLNARRALLDVIAADAAAVAKHTHKRAIIEGLSAYERRKVHTAVKQDSEVETLSDGEGEFRYMMVAIKT